MNFRKCLHQNPLEKQIPDQASNVKFYTAIDMVQALTNGPHNGYFESTIPMPTYGSTHLTYKINHTENNLHV